jgi:hypothetical protein
MSSLTSSLDYELYVQAKGGHGNFMLGRPTLNGTADIVIADMPEDLCFPGLSSVTPEWNRIGDFYSLVFKFASRYLDDDGGLILITPVGVLDSLSLMKLLEKFGLEISIDWVCHQPVPLAHPNYSSKEVIFSHFHNIPSLYAKDDPCVAPK